MKIALTTQLSLRRLEDLLDESSGIPQGLGGTSPLPEVRALIERGHEVSLVTLDSGISNEVVLRGNRLTVYVGPFRDHRAARDGFKKERRFVKEALLRCEPDVVHAHWTYEFALGALATGLPTVVTAHDAPLAILRHNLPKLSREFRYSQVPTAGHWMIRTAMAMLVAHKSSRLIAISPYIEDHFRRNLHFRGEITVIPNMLPTVPLSQPNSSVRLPNVGTRFLTVLSSWSLLKNGSTAIEAFAEVRTRRPLASLHMIGKGFEPGGVAENWAAARGIAEGITFVGPIPNDRIFEYLAVSDILVHPSLEESFGMPLAEAQLAGVAVIGGVHSGAVPWTLDYGRAGRLVDVRRQHELAEAMVDLADDSAIRSDLVRAGGELVRHRHDPNRLIMATEAVLHAVALDHRKTND
jgi:glycosyltransferase involved in cell wall biosynthesis